MKFYCYFYSMNSTLDQVSKYMKMVWDDVATPGWKVIVLSDLNAKSVDWGSPATDKKERILCE
nr:unnamed protein product [Callosobruchus chinensis]